MSSPAMVVLDASAWQSASDFYDGLLSGLNAPDWHGRNVDALIDSMMVGGINGVEPPVHIAISGVEMAAPKARDALLNAMAGLAEEGARCLISHGTAIIEVAGPDQPFSS